MKRKILAFVSCAAILSACSYEKYAPDDNSINETKNVQTTIDNEEESDVNNSIVTSISEDVLNGFKTLSFSKEIPLISVTEMNNKALYENPDSGIATTKALFIKKEHNLFIYNNGKSPNKKTDIIVLESNENFDELLAHNLKPAKKTYSGKFEPIEKSQVNNSNRLFLNKSYKIKPTEDKKVIISFNGEDFTLDEGSKKTFKLKNGEVKSSLTFEYNGILDPSVDIYKEKQDKNKVVIDDSKLTGK